MITGDNWVTARMIAHRLGIRHVTAEARHKPCFFYSPTPSDPLALRLAIARVTNLQIYSLGILNGL